MINAKITTKEVEIINEIYEHILNVNLYDFDSFEYMYKLNREEGWNCMGLVYKLNERPISQNDFDIVDSESLEILSEKLNSIMLEKTGGEWTKFILIFKNSRVDTKFEYQVQSLI